jgi:endonuclease V-like protein UPF0215 family
MKNSRILSIDDSPIKNKKVLCVGVASNGLSVEGVLTFSVLKDGVDSSKKIIQAVGKSRFRFSLILIHGVMLGGFNIVDLNLVFKKTGVPVVCVFKKKPYRGMLETVERLFGLKKRLLIERAGKLKVFNKLCFYHAGLNEKQARNFLSCLTVDSFPWSLRLAHLIGSGVVLGESKGRI